jgi:putative glycosyltransferase (TIGR04372 family)
MALPSHTASGFDNILLKARVNFKFTPEEEGEAKAWLRLRGWKDQEPFVCLLARDSAYLTPTQEHLKNDFNYHNYRDSDIDTYNEAIQALLDKGYWVIRLGKVMHKPLSLDHPKVIDYPFVNDQKDLMDIWLPANCLFFISTSSGSVHVAGVYKRPIVFVNALPLVFGFFWANRIWVPKHLLWEDTHQPLTLKEHCEHSYGFAKNYQEAKIIIKDLSSAEITDAVMECEQRTVGTWVETEEDKARQRLFWDVLSTCPKFYNSTNSDYVHPEARAGKAWLASMTDAFFE